MLPDLINFAQAGVQVRSRSLAHVAQETERLRGPPLKAAFTADGQTTKALQGFARKNRVGESKIMREGDHIWADVQTGGLSAYEVQADPMQQPLLLHAHVVTGSMLLCRQEVNEGQLSADVNVVEPSSCKCTPVKL